MLTDKNNEFISFNQFKESFDIETNFLQFYPRSPNILTLFPKPRLSTSLTEKCTHEQNDIMSLFGNTFLKIENKTIFFLKWCETGIFRVTDLPC